jgi:hypothetical protein
VVHQARAPGEPPTRVVNVVDGRRKSLAMLYDDIRRTSIMVGGRSRCAHHVE